MLNEAFCAVVGPAGSVHTPDPIVVDGRLTPTSLDRRAAFLRRRTHDPQKLWHAQEGQGSMTEQMDTQHKEFILEPTTDTRIPSA